MHPDVHSSTIYKSQMLEATSVPFSKWVDQKTMVHLHNGILCSRKKEGAPIIYNSMDRPGDHYAKWHEPVSERQIPYDLTNKWNLINKTSKGAKYNQRHWNKEQIDTNQRGWGVGDNGVKKGKSHQGTCIKSPWTKPKGRRFEGSSWGWLGWGKVVAGK